MIFAPAFVRHVLSHVFPHTHHLGVQVIEVVNDDGLGEHGFLGRPPFFQTVVADDDVRENVRKLLGEFVHEPDHVFEDHDTEGDMAEEPAPVGEPEAPRYIQFLGFSDIVEDGAGDYYVPVTSDEGRGGHAHPRHAEGMIEKPADVDMMHRGRGGIGEEPVPELRVVVEGLQELRVS